MRSIKFAVGTGLILLAMTSLFSCNSSKDKEAEKKINGVVSSIQSGLPVAMSENLNFVDARFDKKDGNLIFVYEIHDLSKEDSVSYRNYYSDDEIMQNSIRNAVPLLKDVIPYLEKDKIGFKIIYKFKNSGDDLCSKAITYEECAEIIETQLELGLLALMAKGVTENECPFQLDEYTILYKMNYKEEGNELQFYCIMNDLFMSEYSDVITQDYMDTLAHKMTINTAANYREQLSGNEELHIEDVNFVTVLLNSSGEELAREGE